MNAPTINPKPPPPLPKTKTKTTVEPSAPPPPPSAPTLRGLAIDIAKVHESPSNPRKRFPAEEKLRELGESMRDKGQLQDVLVRPHPTKKGDFELVFGACRYRAAKLVGLKTIGASCRELSDAEVLEIQIIENGQRSDVHPLEEAEGYEQLHTKHGYAVPQIAAKVNKSREYVYTRLKLLALCPKAREAFYEERLTSSTAYYIARIPEGRQLQAITEIAEMSAREALDHIRQRYMLRLVDAPFDRKDATLVPAAGSCLSCPKRTGNAKEIFSDVKQADICTDPDCFAAKRDAEWTRRAVAAKEKNQEVLKKPVEQFHDYGATEHLSLDVKCSADPKLRTYRELLQGVKDAPAVAAIGRTPNGEIVELVKRDELQAAIAKKHSFAKKRVETEKEQAKRQADMGRTLDVDRKRRELTRDALVKAVERRQPKPLFYVALILAFTGLDDRMLVDACERRGLGSEPTEALASVKDEGMLRGILAELVFGVPSHVDEAGRSELLEAYGITEKSFDKEARAAVKADAQRKEKKAS